MAAEENVNVNNLVQTIVQHPTFRETVNSILKATNQDQTTNIVNADTNQINRSNSTNISSAGSTSNSSSNFVTNHQFRFESPAQELSSILRHAGGSIETPGTQFQRGVNYTPRRRSTPSQRRVGTSAAAVTFIRNVNIGFFVQNK